MYSIICLFLLPLIFFQATLAATNTYNWDISWISANPDGRAVRPVIAINGQFPPPTITGDVGDTIVVNVNNNLGNQSLTIHWHGLPQTGNNANDGTPMIAQCPIIPGTSYTYTFKFEQPGTYWYHSHASGQYLDGLRGPMIVHDPNNPYKSQFDSELVMTLSDWYHDQGPALNAQYVLVAQNPWGGSEPVPKSGLMNDQINPKFSVTAGKTYFLRIINMSGFAAFFLHIPGHNFTIIETDGVYTQPKHAKDLYLASGQRYGVLLQTHPASEKNFPILASMDLNGFDPAAVPADLQQNVTGALVYDSSKPVPTRSPDVSAFGIIDDFNIKPYDGMGLLKNVDMQIVLGLSFFLQKAGPDQYRSGFNNITFIEQKVPMLYTALSAGDYATDRSVYGRHTNAHVLKANDVVEIVINNYDGGPHPIHIHGHQVQLVARSDGVYNRTDTSPHKHSFLSTGAIDTNAQATALGYGNSSNSMPATPMRRDTWQLAPNGYTVIRFVANNPGVWFLHCHFEWHMEAGLLMTLVEDPIAIQKGQPNIPQQMQTICKKQDIPLIGNAAGNSQDYKNLTGQIRVAPAPRGATYP